MNPDPDYSAAYVIVRDDAGDGLEGHGLTFTIGRGTRSWSPRSRRSEAARRGPLDRRAVRRHGRVLALAGRRQPAALDRAGEGRHPPRDRGGRQRRLGPVREARGKPLWQLLCDMTPESRSRCRLPVHHRRPDRRSRGPSSGCADAPGRDRARPSSSETAIRPTPRRSAGWATTTTRCGGSAARRSPTAGTASR